MKTKLRWIAIIQCMCTMDTRQRNQRMSGQGKRSTNQQKRTVVFMHTSHAGDNYWTFTGGCGGPFLPLGMGGRVGSWRDGGGGRGDVSRDGSGGGCLEKRGVEGGDGGPFLCCAVILLYVLVLHVYILTW